jgi:fengycin family lipopeptide synthetase D
MIYKMEPHNPAYNLGGSTTLLETIDKDNIIKVISTLVRRHEGFRTRFREIGQKPVQIIEHTAPVNVETVDLSHLSEGEWQTTLLQYQWQERMTPFRLEQGPLLRVKLLTRHAKHHELLFIMHHIIADGWSMDVLYREFKLLYESYREDTTCNLEPLDIQYKDYAAWHNQLLADEEKAAKAKESWKNYLKGTLPVLNLPYDIPNPTKSTTSAAFQWAIPGELCKQLHHLAETTHSSLFMVLLAGFNILFSQICGQKDIVLAVPAAARQHESLKNIIGMFVNTLVLRTTVKASETFLNFFKEFRADIFQVLEYQSYPMELIFSELKIKYPQIFVFFNMVNLDNAALDTLKDFEPHHIEHVQDTKFDIHCYLTEYKNGIGISCHYFKERFMPETIEKIAHLYTKVLENIAGKPGEKIEEYSFTGKKKILKRKI